MKIREKVAQFQSFLTLEKPLGMDYLDTLFATTHSRYQQSIPQWDASSTRQKLIAHYWLTHVFLHFSLISGMPALILWPFITNSSSGYLLVVLLVSSFCFLVLLVTAYIPTFISDFLPKVEAVVSDFRDKQEMQKLAVQQEKINQQRQEQHTQILEEQATMYDAFQKKLIGKNKLIEQKQLEIDNCKRNQLPNPTILLIHYAMDKASGMNAMQPTLKYATLLSTLYGVSEKGLFEHLKEVMGVSAKIKGPSKLTNSRSRFEEAYEFFERQNFPKAVEILQQLERKIQA